MNHNVLLNLASSYTECIFHHKVVSWYLGVPGAHEDVRDVLGVARPPVQRLAAAVGQHGDLQLAEDGGQGAAWGTSGHMTRHQTSYLDL